MTKYWLGKKRPDMIGNTFAEGHDPWNKGKVGIMPSQCGFQRGNSFGHIHKGRTKEKYEYLHKVSEHHMNEGNPVWKGGISKGYLDKIAKSFGMKRLICSICGFKKKGRNIPGNNYIVIHHIDGNRTNNKKSNLKIICQSCHVRHHKPRKGTGKAKI